MKLIIRNVRGLPAPWVWAVFAFLVFTLAPVISEVMRFYELRRFFDLSVASGCYVLVVIISAVLIGIGIRQVEEKERRIQRLERWEPPVIRGTGDEVSEAFKKLDLPEHIPILERLFRDHNEVVLKKRFSGGYKNSGVFLVGHPPHLVDCVVKFAPSKDIKEELDRRRLIEGRLGNAGGRYLSHDIGPHDNAPGAVVYTLAGFGEAESLLDFAEFYGQMRDLRTISGLVTRLFTRVLPHSGEKTAGPLRLFEEYSRLARKLPNITIAVQDHPDLAHVRVPDAQVTVALPGVGDVTLRNPLNWTHTTFQTNLRNHTETDAYAGIVHGDLHSGNILIELPQLNIWIIDFARTRQGHTLDDFCRLEADIKFVLTGVAGGKQDPDVKRFFQQAYEFEKTVLSPTSARKLSLTMLVNPSQDPQFGKAWECVAAIRDEATNHLVGPSIYPYYLGLLHATLPVMYYAPEQCNRWQKLYAFVSAGLICERLDRVP